jgi:hypothetical protein
MSQVPAGRETEENVEGALIVALKFGLSTWRRPSRFFVLVNGSPYWLDDHLQNLMPLGFSVDPLIPRDHGPFYLL